jgi:hypothetical protein
MRSANLDARSNAAWFRRTLQHMSAFDGRADELAALDEVARAADAGRRATRRGIIGRFVADGTRTLRLFA